MGISWDDIAKGAAGVATGGISELIPGASNIPQVNAAGQPVADQKPYFINDGSITGNPGAVGAGADTTYGLNDVWNNVSNAVDNLQKQNYNIKGAQLPGAPQAQAAQGAAATGQAALGTAAQGQASSYDAAQAQAAQIAASQVGQVAGQAATGNTSYLTGPAQMQAAQGGFATAGATPISTAGDAAFQAQQQQLANTLQRTANGQGVSPADLQLQQGMQQQAANQLAVLGSQRGATNAALAQRIAGNQTAAAEANTNQQLGIQRAQETQAAQQALGSVLGTARGQAQNFNVNQANLNQNVNLANAANAQAATLQNTGYQQQAAQTNVGNAQATNLANTNAANAMTQFNVGQANNILGQNLSLAQQGNEFNATNSQNAALANMTAQDQMALANMGATNTANAQNSQQAQGMTTTNLASQNAMTGQNLNAINTMTGANLGALNNMTGLNVGAQNTLAGANLGVASQFGLQQGQLNETTQQLNQQYQAQAEQQYLNQFMSLTGVQAALGTQFQNAALADQQLQVNQNDVMAGINAAIESGNAQAAANLWGALIGGGATFGASALKTTSDKNLKAGISGGNPMLQSFLQYADLGANNGMRVTPLSNTNVPHYGNAANPYSSFVSGINNGLQIAKDTQKNNTNKAIPPAHSPSSSAASLDPNNPWEEAKNPPDTSSPADQLSFGQGVVPTITGVGYDNSDQLNDQLMSMPSFGANTVPFTPTSEAPELDPSVTEALSDDRQKEDVISGNRGMQAFLQQQNNQTQANNTGANNSFMETQFGGSRPTQADRQMPFQNPNAGYGAPQYMSAPQFQGSPSAGGISNYGGFMGGGFAAGPSMYDQGWSPSSITQNAGFNGGGFAQGGTFQNAGVNNPGAVLTQGGVSQGANVNMTPQNPKWMNTGELASLSPYLQTIPQGSPSGYQSPLETDVNYRSVLSDEKQKQDKNLSPDEVQDMLDHLHAYSYQYKDKAAGMPGVELGKRYTGTLAQDWEKSDLGKSFVMDTPNGKVLNMGASLGAQWAALAMVNDRLNKLEGK